MCYLVNRWDFFLLYYHTRFPHPATIALKASSMTVMLPALCLYDTSPVDLKSSTVRLTRAMPLAISPKKNTDKK